MSATRGDDDRPPWEPLGRWDPRELVDARLQLHHAVQVAASAGNTLLEPRDDDGHPNLGWLAAHRALAGHALPGERPFRAALRPADLALLLVDEGGDAPDVFSLAGGTLEAAYAWLARGIEVRTGRELESGVARTGYDLPPHAVADGATFALGPAAPFAELGRWFGNAHALLVGLARGTEGASDVRCWPHHFDIATLVTVETGDDGSAAKTVGLGLSPGDGTFAEPYWYVSPWPYPDADAKLDELPAGAWHREGFTAAILAGSELVAGGPEAEQADRARAFLEAALVASRHALGS